MNEKIEFCFWGIEALDNCFFVLILNWHIPQYKIAVPSNNTEYVEIYNKVYKYVVTERHFLDKDINVNIIVRQCDVKKKSLNKVLRLKDDVAFHGYINKQRVIYASTLLLDPSNKLIEVVASEASFNNSRTFVRNFKVVYNMTPSEYRRRNGLKKT
nr:helix-turn-helix domain-containing protein [Parabacteroides goldsteinii]